MLGCPAAASAGGSAGRWSWPLPAPHPIVGGFIAPANPYGSGHRGIDISTAAVPVAAAVTVSAPADGVVHFVGMVAGRPVISLRHADGLVSSYEPVQSQLTSGAVVVRGEPIGILLAGHCEQTCLHFGVRRYGEYVSPLNYLGDIPRSVLLPTRQLSPQR